VTDKPPAVHIGENSPEEVALKLLHTIAYCEGKIIAKATMAAPNADRAWVLDTYAACLIAVKGNRIVSKP